MITNKDLPEVAEYSLPYGEDEIVLPNIPIGLQDIPAEWNEKSNGHRFFTPQCYVLNNVRLAGPNLTGFLHDDLVLAVGYYGRLDLWERNRTYFQIANEVLKHKPKRISCAFSMAGVWSGTYFHWLIDHLPTLQAYYKYRQETGEVPVVLLSGKNPSFVTESLDMLGIIYYTDEKCNYLVDRLVVPTWPRENGFMRPSAAKFVKKLFRRKPSGRTGRRLYISRRNAETRRVENAEVIENYLLKCGFEIALMENLTFKEQRELMAEAEWIVGPHGAGLANMVTADRPKVIEFVTPAYTNPCCWLVGEAIGARYGYVIGEPVGKEDMRVDYEILNIVMSKVGC